MNSERKMFSFFATGRMEKLDTLTEFSTFFACFGQEVDSGPDKILAFL
jgi:hypothetical protein